jgi:hypothetical protein
MVRRRRVFVTSTANSHKERARISLLASNGKGARKGELK